MKTYKFVIKINADEQNPPDWLIHEIRDLVKNSRMTEMTYVSIETVDE